MPTSSTLNKSLLFCCIFSSLSLHAQSRIGVGLALNFGKATLLPEEVIGVYEPWRFFDESESSLLPTLSYQYCFSDKFTLYAETQLNIKQKFTHSRPNFFRLEYRHKFNFVRSQLGLRYQPHPNIFIGLGPSLEVLTYRSSERIYPVGPPDENYSSKPFSRRLAIHSTTGFYFKGFEAQLTYFYNPFYKARFTEYYIYQLNVTRNLLVPSLRYTIALGRKK